MVSQKSEPLLLLEEITQTITIIERPMADGLCNSLTHHVDRLLGRCCKAYPDLGMRLPIQTFIIPRKDPSSINNWPIYKERAYINLLYSKRYIEFHIGNPVANKLLSEALVEAGKALDSGYPQCAAILTRVALESTLKQMCEMNNIDSSEIKMAGNLVKTLHQKQVIDKPMMHLINSKLSILNPAAHGEMGPSLSEIQHTITWAEKFLASVLEGKENPVDAEKLAEIEKELLN